MPKFSQRVASPSQLAMDSMWAYRQMSRNTSRNRETPKMTMASL